MSAKIHIYFVPGLGASSKIFERIDLPKDRFELHYLDWILPLAQEETLSNYAQRMCMRIKHENPILIGVSFGGVMVQEMSKFLSAKKVIIISSIKSNKELPKRLKLAKITKTYKLFPSNMASNFEAYEKYFLGDFLQKKAELYKVYMSARNPLYLSWAIHNVLHWQQEVPLENVLHIHGNDDGVFPIKHIKNAIEIEKGTHTMILTKAKPISKIIEKECLFVTLQKRA